MKKNLGGDRIGSGAKMDVQINGVGRSTHSLTTDIATTMSFGTLLPIHHSLVMAGDTREIEIEAMAITKPTEGPLFASAKFQVDVFKFDFRLFIAKLHMNLLEAGLDMSRIKVPLIKMTADKIDWTKDPSNQQINPSSIFKFLHISGLGDTLDNSTPMRYFMAIAWLGYWEIYKNYYANKQEKIGAVIHTGELLNENIQDIKLYFGLENTSIARYPEDNYTYPITSTDDYIIVNFTGSPTDMATVIFTTNTGDISIASLFQELEIGDTQIRATKPTQLLTIINWRYAGGTDPIATTPRVRTFDLQGIDDMKMNILADIKNTGAFILDEADTELPEPYNLALQKNSGIYSKMMSQEGLALKTYQSDLFNNWLDAEWINDINTRSAITVDGGQFTMDQFLLKEKLYNYLNRIATAGGTVDDMMEVTYDVKSISRSEIPVFEGGLSKELVFQQVISNAASQDQPLGTIAGRGTFQGHKGGKIRIHNNDTQHAMYMVIASLTPRLKYTQGNSWLNNIKTYDDIFKPQFDQLGFQDLITDQMAYWDTKVTSTGNLTTKSAGKQPAWINYQTEIDRAFGNFAIPTSEGWMIFDRSYDWDETEKQIKDLTTYIDPAKYNGVFAYKALDAQNIWLQVKIVDTARRKMSANQLPKLT